MITTEEKQIIKRAVAKPVESMRGLVMDNLYFFLQYFWPTYSEDTFIPAWHIREISKELEIVARRVSENKAKLYDLLFNVPPGTTKTALVSIFFPVWCWVNWYWMRFITSSHSSSLSLESAEYSRDIVRSGKFKDMFPEIEIKQDKDVKSNFRVVKREGGRLLQGGGRVSTSVGAKIMGFHGHIDIWDDLVDPTTAISLAGIEAANKHIQTLATRKVDKEVTVTIGIMQRLGTNDPTAYLLSKKNKKIKHICLPGELKNYSKLLKPEKYRKFYKNDLLDPKRLSWNALHDMLIDLGQYGYHGQVGQDPQQAGSGMFETKHLSIIDHLPVDLYIVQTVRYWDKAATPGGGAFTVGVKMCKLKDGRFIVMDIKRGQWGTSKRERIIKETAIADGTKCKVYVEQEPGSGGKDSAVGTIKNLAGFAVYADRPTGDKVYRADPFSVQVNEGNVSMLRAGWNDVYVEELRDFPVGTYKDQTDASSGAFNKLIALKQIQVITR